MGPRLIEDVKLLIDQGWNVIRTWIDERDSAGRRIFEPRESIAATATWLTKLREEVGSAPVIGVDYHHRLSVAEATSFCQRMPRGTIDFLEEPIRDETPAAYASLRTMTDVPFAIGEELASKWQFLPYIESGLTRFARIDVCNVGGLTESMKVAGWCEAHYIDLMPHNPLGAICTAATVHFADREPRLQRPGLLPGPDGARRPMPARPRRPRPRRRVCRKMGHAPGVHDRTRAPPATARRLDYQLVGRGAFDFDRRSCYIAPAALRQMWVRPRKRGVRHAIIALEH